MRPAAMSRFCRICAAVVCAAAFAAATLAAQENPPPSGEPEATGEFGRKELRWAAGWINREVSRLMALEIIKKITARNGAFELHVGEQWHELSFSRQGLFLQHLSRAREITGHAPFFVVRDHETNDVVARVSARGIQVYLPGEGMFAYQFSRDPSLGTVY